MMTVKGVRKTGEYYDSVTLMLVARSLTEKEGVTDATVVMGTEENKDILRASGMLISSFENASDTDLLIVVKAEDTDVVDNTLQLAEQLLKESKNKKAETGEHLPKSVEGALRQVPDSNMVVISVAGRYAADVARDALNKGLHVMMFSDNVSVDKERELKEMARNKGLLMMGPDCGTAIINGAPLCFANVIERGDIGLVAASGTGLQEVSSIIGNLGGGISQAIGTGGRDVKKEIGGLMFLEGLKALDADPATKVIVLVSKPPAVEVQQNIAAALKDVSKPVVAILIGGDASILKNAGVWTAEDLEQAAFAAVAISKGKAPESSLNAIADRAHNTILPLAQKEAARMGAGQKYLRGLFSGGTLCDETQLLFQRELGAVWSPAPIDPAFKLNNIWKSRENTVIDLGEDEFTVGRPHPMIDFMLRKKRIVEEASDPETAVILMDVVLGYGSNMAPGEELAPAIKKAKEMAASATPARHLSVVCSITGTDKDPQNRAQVRKELEDAGAIVMDSNAAASLLTVEIIRLLNNR